MIYLKQSEKRPEIFFYIDFFQSWKDWSNQEPRTIVIGIFSCDKKHFACTESSQIKKCIFPMIIFVLIHLIRRCRLCIKLTLI